MLVSLPLLSPLYIHFSLVSAVLRRYRNCLIIIIIIIIIINRQTGKRTEHTTMQNKLVNVAKRGDMKHGEKSCIGCQEDGRMDRVGGDEW